MPECKDAGKKLLELIWVDTDKSVSRSQENSIETVCQGIQDEEAKRYSKSFTSQLTTGSRESVGVNMMSVSWSNIRETVEVETQRHQQSTFPWIHLNPFSSRRSSEIW